MGLRESSLAVLRSLNERSRACVKSVCVCDAGVGERGGIEGGREGGKKPAEAPKQTTRFVAMVSATPSAAAAEADTRGTI